MTDWGEIVRAGSRLGILPPALWALSLREWRWLQGGAAGDAAITPAVASALLSRARKDRT